MLSMKRLSGNYSRLDSRSRMKINLGVRIDHLFLKMIDAGAIEGSISKSGEVVTNVVIDDFTVESDAAIRLDRGRHKPESCLHLAMPVDDHFDLGFISNDKLVQPVAVAELAVWVSEAARAG